MLQENFRTFLKDLSQNNNREWFHANKKRYEKELKKPFQNLVGELIESLKAFDKDIEIAPKDAIFRINRDTRFSKDKTPYKTNVGAVISKYGRKAKDYPGFYIHIEQGVLMIGGGAYFLEKDALYKVRQYIVNHPFRFQSILDTDDFKNNFGELKGDKNKRLPKEFKDIAEAQPLIANKQFYFMAELPPTTIHREDLVSYMTEYLQAGKPLNDFLIEAIYG